MPIPENLPLYGNDDTLNFLGHRQPRPNQPSLYVWRKNSKRGAVMGIQNEGDLHSKAEFEALKRENEQLKLTLAEAELDKRILKKN